jgi:glutathione S-transferase
MLKLYYSPGACSLAPHIALEEAGADYEAVRVTLAEGAHRTPEYLRLNPKGRVPALETERGVLTENPAILAWIAQSFPEAGLAPVDDPWGFGEVQAFNGFLSSTVHIAFAHVFRPGRYADGAEAAAAMKAKAPSALEEAFALVEDRLSDGRPFAHGESYTVSDPYLFVFARWFTRDGLGDHRRFQRLTGHRERMNARPAVARVLAREGLPLL